MTTKTENNEQFSTGSVRDSREGKGRYDLLMFGAIHLLALHLERGAKRYGDRNWERGQPISRYMDSTMRHLTQFIQGEEHDVEGREAPIWHLVASAWNALAALETMLRVANGKLTRDLMDLPWMEEEASEEAPDTLPMPSVPMVVSGPWEPRKITDVKHEGLLRQIRDEDRNYFSRDSSKEHCACDACSNWRDGAWIYIPGEEEYVALTMHSFNRLMGYWRENPPS